jgi:hypothetical protein
MQSNGILKLVQKVTLLLVFQTIDHQNLANFGQRKVTNSYFKIWVIENPWNYEIGTGPLVSRPCCLTGQDDWACVTLRAMMRWWPYTTSHRRPTWASQHYPARGQSRRRFLPFLFLAIAHGQPPLLYRMRHSAHRGQPPPSHRRAIQWGQREHHDAMHLLHRV